MLQRSRFNVTILRCSFIPILTMVVLLSCVVVTARPNYHGASNGEVHEVYSDNVQNFLMNFGYLPKSEPNALTSRKSEEVKRAIVQMQKFAGLEPTGRMDNATKKLLTQKRCGLPDVPTKDFLVNARHAGHGRGHRNLRHRHRSKRYVLQGPKWPRTNLTYKIHNYSPDLGTQAVRRAVYDALKAWQDVSSLSFTETNSEHADIVVSFYRGEHGDGYPFDGVNAVLAHAFFPGEGYGGDVHFDDDEVWTDGEEVSLKHVNLFSVAVHEFGHSLGLAHSEATDAVMNPYYRHDPSLRRSFRLPYDDVVAIQRAYGSGGKPVPTAPPPTAATPQFETSESQTTTTLTPLVTGPPTACDTHVDAVARIRNELFVFKGRYFWRFDEVGYLIERPVEIQQFWFGFPDHLDRIDAAFEDVEQNKLMFFKDDRYWEFTGHYISHRTPEEGKPLTNLGLPSSVKKIDAAFVWEYTKKAYFFTSDEYYRFDEKEAKVDLDYPRKLDLWRNVPYNVDAAFTSSTGITYFLKDDQIYRFNNHFMRVEKGWPQPLRSFWTHCGGRTLAKSNLLLAEPDNQKTSSQSATAHNQALKTSFSSSGAVSSTILHRLPCFPELLILILAVATLHYNVL